MVSKPGKDRPAYRCDECGNTAAKWLGRCPECQAWGSLLAIGAGPALRRVAPGQVSAPALPIGDVTFKVPVATPDTPEPRPSASPALVE